MLFRLYLAIEARIFKLLNRYLKKDSKVVVFIPHGGCLKDAYSMLNFKSDNSLSFMRYIMKNYGTKYKYRVAVDVFEYEKSVKEISGNFSDLDIACFPFFNVWQRGLKYRLYWEIKNFINIFSKASYIFTSEGCQFHYKTKQQTIVYLGYYIPFKNDYLPVKAGVSFDMNSSKTYDYCISTSLLSSQIISHTYNIPLYKFHQLGFSRNDELLTPTHNEYLEEFISKSADYAVKKVILYTPTHRDYEKMSCSSRDIMGFDIDNNMLSSLLQKHKAIIVCKIHSKQNTEALRKQLPKGLVLHEPNPHYGLCELMQYSDCLITDYTSAYFDYLLLDKPVIFNFYDFDKYKNVRGFSYDPLDSIIAGDVFIDSKSFYNKLEVFLSAEDKWSDKRTWVKNLVHKYTDTNSSERIYDFIFCHGSDKKTDCE